MALYVIVLSIVIFFFNLLEVFNVYSTLFVSKLVLIPKVSTCIVL